MIVGSSFNATGFGDGRWNTDSAVSTSTDPATFHGVPSEKLSYSASGKGSAGVSNRGLGNAGLVFEASKEYEGYLFAKAASALSLTVTLEDYVTKKVLETQTLSVGSGDFARYGPLHNKSVASVAVDTNRDE